MIKKLRWLFAALILFCAGLGAKAWHDTMRAPVVQQLTLESGEMPSDARPVTIALLADIHVAGPDMPPARLERIVEQTNALKPDLIAIAGDLVSEKRSATKIYSAEEIAQPLGRLRARLGVVLVPGNHDHWFDWPALSKQLGRFAQITILANQSAQFGPLAVVGVDDDFTGRADVEASAASAQGLSGPRIWLTHSPDIFPAVPTNADLVLAGHTHCGQIAYPWGGSPATMSEYGDAFACGVVEQHGKTLVTSAGLGTSLIPLRLFTQPEIWLITIRPKSKQPPQT